MQRLRVRLNSGEAMKEVIEKLSSYNLFNYLLPGILFAAFGDYITAYKIIQKDLLIGLFLYYFVGLVISRIGSLILEPIMRRVRFVTFAPYTDFVRASQHDRKIDLFSEQNNMYRTLCALFLSLGMLKFFEIIADSIEVTPEFATYILLGLLFLLLAASYRKQTGFIKKRVELANSSEHDAHVGQ